MRGNRQNIEKGGKEGDREEGIGMNSNWNEYQGFWKAAKNLCFRYSKFRSFFWV